MFLSLPKDQSSNSLRDAPTGSDCSSLPSKLPCEENNHQSQFYLIFLNPVESDQLEIYVLRILSFFAHHHHSHLGMITPIKNWIWLSINFLMLHKLFMKMCSLSCKSKVFQCRGRMTSRNSPLSQTQNLRLTNHSKSCLAPWTTFLINSRRLHNWLLEFYAKFLPLFH